MPVNTRTSYRFLFVASVAALYLEMVLIRWLGTEIRLFAYVQNLALIACFLGFGVGSYRAAEPVHYRLGMFATCGLALISAWPVRAWREFLQTLSELLMFSADGSLWSSGYFGGYSPLWLGIVAVAVLTLLLALLIAAMVPLGQVVGKALAESNDAVSAYSVNLAGSLVGIWIAAGLSFLWIGPVTWFALVFLMILVVRQPNRVVITAACIVVCLTMISSRTGQGPTIIWSPYQKLSLSPLGNGNYAVGVNNTGYMNLANLDAYPPSERPALYALSSYDSPFKFVGNREHMLVIGSGGGNDVAAALRNGVQRVDAVEIDPAILDLGRRFHPDRPYHSEHVNIIVNDARNFMRTTTSRYDIIIFGLLDSHTGFSAQSNMRVDNYVYTEESMREAMHLLKPGGVLAIKFEVRQPWLWMGERFDSMLTRVAGRPPIIYYTPDVGYLTRASIFLTSNSPELWQRAQAPELAAFLNSHPPVFNRTEDTDVPRTSDDWPYVYHRAHTVPRTYLTVTAVLLFIALYLVGRTIQARAQSTWHFLFLWAGFLGMETQMVSRLALYFGSTWLVNCFVVSAVLVVLVAANLFLQHRPVLKIAPFYAVLVLSLVTIYFVPWSQVPLRVTSLGVLLIAAYAVPLFCAGLIFTDSFRRSTAKSSALGANLVGATFGGMAQNLSFIVGLKALLLLAALFYLISWVFSCEAANRPIVRKLAAGAKS